MQVFLVWHKLSEQNNKADKRIQWGCFKEWMPQIAVGENSKGWILYIF